MGEPKNYSNKKKQSCNYVAKYLDPPPVPKQTPRDEAVALTSLDMMITLSV